MSAHRPSLQDVWDHYGRRIISSRGQYQKAECPLLSHNDQNPSASLNEETGKWQCWSCDGHGDVYDIILANEESCAGFADAKRFAEEHFADGGGAVRPQRRSSGGLSVRPTARTGARNWSPPWSGI